MARLLFAPSRNTSSRGTLLPPTWSGPESRRVVFEGRRNGSTTMADREWYWWMESEKTEVQDFMRVEITVATEAEAEDKPLVRLSGFLAGKSDEVN